MKKTIYANLDPEKYLNKYWIQRFELLDTDGKQAVIELEEGYKTKSQAIAAYKALISKAGLLQVI